jgi:hypothetical protein
VAAVNMSLDRCGGAQEELVVKSVFDSSFKYTPSFDTDIRKTFERVRREQRQARRRLPEIPSQPETKVEVLKLGQFTRPSHPKA